MPAGREVLLGVTASVAAYKAPEIARRLLDAGAPVTAVLTPAAERFIPALTLAALTGRAALTDPFNLPDGKMPHLDLAKRCAVLLVAPCSADFLAGLAAGRADTLLASIILTTRASVLLAPAMHEPMWTHKATQKNVAACKEYGYRFVGPAEGPLASGDSGLGRLAAVEEIVNAALGLLAKK